MVCINAVHVCAHTHRKRKMLHLYTQTHGRINTSALSGSPLRGQSHYSLFHYETWPSLSSQGSVWPALATINTTATLSSAVPLNNIFPIETAAQPYIPTPAVSTHILTHSKNPPFWMCPNINTKCEKEVKLWYWFKERQRLSREIYLGLGLKQLMVHSVYWCLVEGEC